jgi:hypothetical protein
LSRSCRTRDKLAGQLADKDSTVTGQISYHRRLSDALVRAVEALGKAHPGSLDELTGKT